MVQLRIVKVHEQPELFRQHLLALRREAGWGEENILIWLEKSRNGQACYVLAYAQNSNELEANPTGSAELSDLVGMIGVTWEDPEGDVTLGNRDEGLIQLTSLVIAKRWQGKGLGLELMRVGESIARELGAKKIVSFTDRTNVASIKLHDRLGYRTYGTTKRVWTEGGPPAVCFDKIL
ncbi:acyl-CoA N-acyltransferase [Cladochytrium replicatum]|nr:acyl-CoA N-acyltransferase [Cladochytrium replicatum]